MTTNDKELRERILIDFLIHEEDCKYSLYDKPCTCVQQQVADSIMHLVSESMRRREAEAENYGRVASLLDLLLWLELHDIEDVTMVQDYVQHVETSIKQSPNQRYIERPELKATIRGEG
jgi:hypothetical protein